jgi:hypothetical protein
LAVPEDYCSHHHLTVAGVPKKRMPNYTMTLTKALLLLSPKTTSQRLIIGCGTRRPKTKTRKLSIIRTLRRQLRQPLVALFEKPNPDSTQIFVVT